jgi:geranylgeranyl pyrophosphate synthase
VPAAEPLVSDAEVTEVLEILERSGAREHALAEARRYRDESLELLDLLPCPPEGRRDLAVLVRSVIAA